MSELTREQVEAVASCDEHGCGSCPIDSGGSMFGCEDRSPKLATQLLATMDAFETERAVSADNAAHAEDFRAELEAARRELALADAVMQAFHTLRACDCVAECMAREVGSCQYGPVCDAAESYRQSRQATKEAE